MRWSAKPRNNTNPVHIILLDSPFMPLLDARFRGHECAREGATSAR
jgi:hypothetical protein